ATGDAFTGSLSRDPGENVGTYVINQNTLALSPNYTITYNSANLAVGAKAITVTVDAKSKTYGASDPALSYTHSPALETGDAFTGSLSRDPGENVGDYTINQHTLALSPNYTIDYNNANLTIGAKTITVTAEAKNKTYGASDPALTYTHSPALATGDAFTGSLSRDPGENVGYYTINQNTLALSPNYTIAYNNANLAIGAKVITVTADAKSKTYGASDPALTYTHSPALTTGDAFSGSLSRDPGEDVGAYAINQNTLALSPNYTIAYNNANLTIGAKAITVTADAKSKTYGASDPALTYTHSPALATGDAFSGSLSRDPGENVGTYVINQNTLALSPNYTITYNSANLAIGAKAITVTADAKNKTYGASDPALTYTHSPALAAGDAFTGSLSRDPGENVGGYAINQNDLALSPNYTITYNNANLIIGTKVIAVTADAKSKTYGASDPALSYTHSPALATGDAFTGALSRVPGEDVGGYAINQNTLALSPNYTITYNSASLAIGAKAITVTADAKTKTYGATDPALTYTYNPALITGDAFTGSLSRVPGENAGVYTINQNTLALSPNYTITYNSANLAIGAKAITVTADAKTKVYGATDPALTYTFSPALVTGDGFTGSLSRMPGENAGVYVINQNTLALSSNYILTYTGANLTIDKRAIAVTADAINKTYGAADPALTYTYTPALAGADVFTGALSRVPGDNVGVYAINQNSLALSSDYILTYTGANLVIGAKPIVVAADTKTKVYGTADPVLTYTYNPSLIAGDAFSGSLSRTSGENIGGYTISQGSLSPGSNYLVTYAGNMFTITAAARTLTFNALPDKTYGDPDFGPGAGVNTGETISYTSSNPAVATIVGGRVHITGAGNTVITASVAANANYTSNPVTSQTLVVNKAAQTIVFTAIPVQMKGAQYSLAGVTASSGLPVTLSSADPQIAVIQGPTLLAQRLGTTTITASQPGNANYLPAATVIQTVTVADAAGDQIQVRPALSPNGDGVNDFLYIEGIRNYADNKVTLINRNGVRIFEIKGYDNATRVFTGQSSITRQKQPAGTYFYLIEYTVNGERKQKTGFIVLKY
ncbi:MAG: MBG domain-containing protein, partial [Chitinophagaceae bacterium]